MPYQQTPEERPDNGIEEKERGRDRPDRGPPSTAVIYDRLFLDHQPGAGHPESPERLGAIYGLLIDGAPEPPFQWTAPRQATLEELLMCHSSAYLDQLAASARRSFTRLSADTFASAGSFQAARLAAGGVVTAIERIVARRCQNAFVLSRPPGHHAEVARAHGYCLINNAAVGALYARRVLGLKRVLIVDWDLHHGNGLQHIFEKDPSVFYFSLHQFPLFPGTGLFTETGLGPGEGYTLNIPLKTSWGDGEYAALFLRLLTPLCRAYRPDLILVAAGFDPHRLDRMGKMTVSEEGFGVMTRVLMDCAAETCGGRLVMVLEGGYHLQALAESVKTVLDVMAGLRTVRPEEIAACAGPRKLESVLHRCRHVHARRWPELFAS